MGGQFSFAPSQRGVLEVPPGAQGDIISFATDIAASGARRSIALMNAANTEWPALLRDYEGAIAEFEGVSRALMAVLAEHNASDDEVRGLVVAEERARETVVLARMRLINLWRESGLEHSMLPDATLASIAPQ
jgi:hypothetical protein